MLNSLSSGKIVIELLIANPPTSKRREMIALFKEAIQGWESFFKIYVVRQGRVMPTGYRPTRGLVSAFKSRKIPSIIIDGKIAFYQEIPSVPQIREYLQKVLRQYNIL